jgi:hypothetical protein
MTSTFLARVGLGLTVGLVCSLGAGSPGGGVGITEARADTAAGQAPRVATPACLLKGTSPVARGTQLFDAPSGGRAIASFTGNRVPMQMAELPADPVNGRAKLITSTGSGSLRIEGYVQASAIPLYTTADVPVMAGNVWIASGQKVRLVHGGSSSARVEMTVAGSRAQNVQGTAMCEGLALQKGAPLPASIPNNARTFLTKSSTTAIYDRPNGDAIFSLQMIEGSSQLFWSTETRAGFVHVRSRADIVIDGWVQWKDLDPLKKGEMMGSDVQPPAPAAAAKLVFDSPPRIATATKDIPVRAKRSDKAKPIGVLEAGAQVYVMETIAGFTNVFPKDLHVLPPEGGGFWIPTSDVPK